MMERRFAKFFSVVFHPLLLVTYGILSLNTFTRNVPQLFAVYVDTQMVLLFFLFSFVIPATAIYLLYRFKRVKDLSLSNRKDRYFPYFIALFCSFFLFFIYEKYIIISWYYRFFFNIYWFSLAVALYSNFILKVSSHALGMGAVTGFVLITNIYTLSAYFWVFVLCVLVSGFVCSARLVLGAHTAKEVGTGYVLGFATAFVVCFLF